MLVDGTQETSGNDEEVATASTSDIQTAEHMQGQQEAYLEPILVAMELGQEILESNDNDGDMVSNGLILFVLCVLKNRSKDSPLNNLKKSFFYILQLGFWSSSIFLI